MLRRLPRSIAGWSRPGVLALGFLLLASVVWADVATGHEISFSIFYTLPIGIVSWYGGKRPGVALALLGAILWLYADFRAGATYSHAAIPYWNAAVRLGLFLLVGVSLSAVAQAIRRDAEHADRDPLTQLLTGPAFYRAAQDYLRGAGDGEKAFALAYLDADDQRWFNERFGRPEGDLRLSVIARTLQQTVPPHGLVARMGGDEFVLLVPGVERDTAPVVLGRVRSALADEEKACDRSMRVSMGVIFCTGAPAKLDAVITRAENLMYASKDQGKDRVNMEYARNSLAAV